MTRASRCVPVREAEQQAADRQTEGLAALALLLCLVALGVFLARTLSSKAAVEDCLMAGQRDCDVVLTTRPPPMPW